MTDNAIINLFFLRDGDAVAELQEKYGQQMKNYAKKCLGDSRDADEVYNDTLADIWNSIPPEHPNRLGAFVMAVLKRRTLDKIKYVSRDKRARSSEVLYADFDHKGTQKSAEDEVIDDNSGAVERFLSQQSKENRIIFVKRYYFGRSVSEVAREMGMSENAVSTRLARTRERLRRYLEDEGVVL